MPNLPRLACTIVTAALLTASAHAQAPNRTPVPATPTVKLTMQDQHVLKENLLKSAQSDGSAGQAELERGKKVPTSVQLHRLPEEIASKIPQIKSHEYFIADHSIVLVDPQQRTIVEVVK